MAAFFESARLPVEARQHWGFAAFAEGTRPLCGVAETPHGDGKARCRSKSRFSEALCADSVLADWGENALSFSLRCVQSCHGRILN
jgi:hypothetical protein